MKVFTLTTRMPDIFSTFRQLLRKPENKRPSGKFGADVNIANVMPDDVIETEALRNGLGVLSAAGAG